MKLQITINGVKKSFGTKTFSDFNNSPMTALSNTFSYSQTYNLNLKGYYFQNTDIVAVKLNNVDSAYMSLSAINNQYNTPLRANNTDFVYDSYALASFSGTNSYALTKNYAFKTPQNTKLIIKKSPTDIENNLKLNYFSNLTVGCTKQFDLILKNASSVSDTVYLEFPFLKEMVGSGLSLNAIRVGATPNKVNFASTPIITPLGGAKYKIDMSYAQTGEAVGTTATYTATIELDFIHISGNFTLKATGFTYTNSNT